MLLNVIKYYSIILDSINEYFIKIDYFDQKGTKDFENNIPIKVFNIKSSGDLIDIVSGSNIGTTIGK